MFRISQFHAGDEHDRKHYRGMPIPDIVTNHVHAQLTRSLALAAARNLHLVTCTYRTWAGGVKHRIALHASIPAVSDSEIVQAKRFVFTGRYPPSGGGCGSGGITTVTSGRSPTKRSPGGKSTLTGSV
jgi:hypothetical protein